MGFAEEMTNLGEQLVTSFDHRIKDVGRVFSEAHDIQREGRKMMNRLHNGNRQLFDETHQLLDDTQKFLKQTRHQQKENARTQQRKLESFCTTLMENNKEFSGNVQQHMRRLRRDFTEGHKAFQRACTTIQRHGGTATFPKPFTGGFSVRGTTDTPRPTRKTRRHKRKVTA